MLCIKFGNGATSRYGSGSNKNMLLPIQLRPRNNVKELTLKSRETFL
jgi:hypothetical protein